MSNIQTRAGCHQIEIYFKHSFFCRSLQILDKFHTSYATVASKKTAEVETRLHNLLLSCTQSHTNSTKPTCSDQPSPLYFPCLAPSTSYSQPFPNYRPLVVTDQTMYLRQPPPNSLRRTSQSYTTKHSFSSYTSKAPESSLKAMAETYNIFCVSDERIPVQTS